MILAGHVLTAAHIVPEVLQLILRIDIRGLDGVLQVLEEIMLYNGPLQVDVIPEPFFRRIKRHIAGVVKGEKADGKVLERQEIFLENIRVLSQKCAIFPVAGLEQLDIGHIKGLVHNLQDILLAKARIV